MWMSLSILLLTLQSSVAKRDTTPVFVIDHETALNLIPTEANPFEEMPSAEFSNIIEHAIAQAKVVVLFVEESFCTEDISVRDKLGSPYSHLGQALRENKARYLPAVSQAFKTLKSHLQPLASYVYYLSVSSPKLRIYDKKLRHFYIYFKDGANETRVAALRRHDLLMNEAYFAVREMAGGPVIAFYTGKDNPVVVDRLMSPPVDPQKPIVRPGVTVSSDGALFRFIGVYSRAGSRPSTFSQSPRLAEEHRRERGLTTRLAYADFELEFSFAFRDDRWTVETVSLLEWGEEMGRTELRAGAPWNWSYVCSEPLVLVNMRDGSAVTISHYQIQAFDFEDHAAGRQGNDTSDARRFGPAVNCGPYFSAQILAGLTVAALCLAILAYGASSLYGVNTNSRYDDPQAKPLVIVAEGGGR